MPKHRVETMKIEKSCRVCAGKESLINVLDPENSELIEILKICANIEIQLNDQKPKQICQRCKEGLEFSYNLRKLGEANERRLQDQIQTNDDDSVVETLEEEELESAEENSNSDEHEQGSPEFLEDDNVIIQSDGRTFQWDQGEVAEDDNYVYEVLGGEEVYEENEEILPHASDENLQEETVTEEVECPSNQEVEEEVTHTVLDDVEAGNQVEAVSKPGNTSRGKKASLKMEQAGSFGSRKAVQTVVIPDETVEQLEEIPEEVEHVNENSTESLSEDEISEDHTENTNQQETIPNFQRNTDQVSTSWIALTERLSDEKGRLKYRCKACGKVAKNKPLHIFHVLKHTGENPYKCTMPGCKKAFRSLAGLESHLIFHGSERNFICDICNASFKHNTVLARHKKIHDTNNRKFNCKYCSGTFLRRFDCTVHESRHKPNEELLKQCNLCDNAFLNGLMLKRHKSEEHGVNDNYKEGHHKTQRTFTCKDCFQPFDGLNALANHKTVCEMNKVFKCRFCSKKFKDLNSHQDHEDNFHDDKWKCKICGYNFDEEDELRTHTIEAHVTQSDRFIINLEPGNGITSFPRNRLKLTFITPTQAEISVLRKIDQDNIGKSYVCPICAALVVGYDDMYYHLSNHGKSEGYVCDKCLAVFESSEDFRIHMLIAHENGKAFVCSICKKVYCTAIGLEQHKAAVHTGKYKYCCDFCNRKFVDMTQMKMHVVNNHINFPDKSKLEVQIVTESLGNDPIFICGICHRRFDKESLLASHMKRHAADYQCKDCGRRCKSMNSYRNHLIIHSNFYPFQCEYCEKPFRNAVKLKTHIRLHTGEKPYVCEFCDFGFAKLESLKLHKYDHVKMLLINQMKEKYDAIKAKDPFPKLPPPIAIARKVVAEENSSGTIIELKCVSSVKDESDEDEEIEEDGEEVLFEGGEIVEWESVTEEQEFIEEVEVDGKSNIYEVVMQDGESLIVEEGDIEMVDYIIEDGQDDDTVIVQQ